MRPVTSQARRRIRLTLALALAGLVHLGLLLVPVRHAVRTVVRPVRLAHVPPPPVAEPSLHPIPSKPRRRRSSPTAAPAKEPPPSESTTAAPVNDEPMAAEPSTPSEVDLFPAVAIDDAATPAGAADELTDEELFAARMARWTSDFHARERVSSGQTPPQVTALGERLWMWYLPGSEELERHAAAGLGVGSGIVPLLEYYTSGRANKPSEAMATAFGDRRHIDPTGRTDLRMDGIPMGCFGHCSDVGHEVARLETMVVIHHDEVGLPNEWSVSETSGDRSFDAEALSAVKAALELTDAAELTGDSPALRSDWVFRVIAYRWSRAELSDPLFIPPGRVLEAHSGIVGKTTMVREVRLVALRFH